MRVYVDTEQDIMNMIEVKTKANILSLLTSGDPCLSNPCGNGGFCEASDDHTQYTCNCGQLWAGPTCTQGKCVTVGSCGQDLHTLKVTV